MPEFLTILILTPTAAVLILSVAYICGIFLLLAAAAVDEVVVATQHLVHHTGHPGVHHTGHLSHA
jgi:hypothetical protein